MPPPDVQTSSAILRVEEASFRYQRRGKPQLQNISFELKRGERCVVMGHNGSGKTTLLRLCAGLLRPSQGSTRWNNGEAWQPMLGPIPDIGYIPQQLGLVRNRTALSNVAAGTLGRSTGWRRLLGFHDLEAKPQARIWLKQLGLADQANERVDRLSGGQRQRVAIARSLVQAPKLLVADEFVSSLDLVRQAEVLTVLQEHAPKAELTLLMALHNYEIARGFASRFLFLRDGQIAADLPSSEVTLEVARRFLQS